MNIKLMEVITEIENELEINGYRMKFAELYAAAEYVILNELEIAEYVEETINNFPELLIEL